MRTLFFIIITVLILVLLLINSFFDKKKYNFKIALVVALLSIIFHFYYYSTIGNSTNISLLLASVRSVSATIKLFGGYTLVNDTDFVKMLEHNATYAMLFYYILHILAFSMTLSAIVLSIGKQYICAVYRFIALQNIQGDYFVFYKFNNNTEKLINKIDNTNKINKNKFNRRVIILDDNLKNKIEDKFNDLVWDKHCIVLSEDLKDKYIQKLLKDKKDKRANIKLFIVSDNYDENYELASSFYENIKSIKDHNDINLIVISEEYYNYDSMLKDNGFSYIRSFNMKDIISRLLVKNYPPCEYVDFENCRAKEGESFNCLIVGFGELGQKIFKRLFVYGQFVDSKFNCKIIDRNYNNICSEFVSKFDFILDDNISKQYEFITKNVNIDKDDNFSAQSEEFYKFIKDNAQSLDYIVVATDEKTNNDVVKNLLYLRKKLGNAKFDIFDCLANRIYAYQSTKQTRKKTDIFDYILDNSIDEAGKLINYAYSFDNPEDISNVDINESQDMINAKWIDEKCGAYEKNSSISAAEFYKTILKIIGKKIDDDYEEVLNYLCELPKEQKYSLGKIEHNRWCAFLLAEGFRYMDYDNINGKGQKDIENKKHACLISWEDLPKLGEIQKLHKGVDPKYQESDMKNVIMAIRIAELVYNINKQN